MIQKTIKIKHKNGLHMRPSMFITDIAMKFNSDIVIYKEDLIADAKSIMQLTVLGVVEGDELTIRAEGEDEQEAIDALEELIINDFKDLLGIKN